MVASKLRKHASIWWEYVKSRHVRERKPKIRTWDKMKKKLSAKFLPTQYRQDAIINNFKQRNLTVEHYTNEFDLFMVYGKNRKNQRARHRDYGDRFPVGTNVQAVWSEDGEWYEGTIEELTPIGYYIRYDWWGNREEVDVDNVRAIQEGSVDPLLKSEELFLSEEDVASIVLNENFDSIKGENNSIVWDENSDMVEEELAVIWDEDSSSIEEESYMVENVTVQGALETVSGTDEELQQSANDYVRIMEIQFDRVSPQLSPREELLEDIISKTPTSGTEEGSRRNTSGISSFFEDGKIGESQTAISVTIENEKKDDKPMKDDEMSDAVFDWNLLMKFVTEGFESEILMEVVAERFELKIVSFELKPYFSTCIGFLEVLCHEKDVIFQSTIVLKSNKTVQGMGGGESLSSKSLVVDARIWEPGIDLNTQDPFKMEIMDRMEDKVWKPGIDVDDEDMQDSRTNLFLAEEYDACGVG